MTKFVDIKSSFCSKKGRPKDPHREAIIRAYARAIGSYIPHEYAFGLDMGLTENDAALVVDELHDRKAATGKPTSLGGIPYDELMITAFWVVESLDVDCQEADMELRGSRVVIQGFGAVGKGVARFCQDKGSMDSSFNSCPWGASMAWYEDEQI